MKKLILSLCVFSFLGFVSCGDDDEPTTELKTVTIEIERSSEFLPALEDNNSFTVSTETVYNKSDWSTVVPNEGKVILTKVNSNLTEKVSFTLKQERVNLQLISTYFIQDDEIDEDEIDFETKVTIKVNDKVVKTQSFPFARALPNIITYTE